MGTKDTLNVPHIEILTMLLWGNKNWGDKIPPLEYRGVIYPHIYAHIYENHIYMGKVPLPSLVVGLSSAVSRLSFYQGTHFPAAFTTYSSQ